MRKEGLGIWREALSALLGASFEVFEFVSFAWSIIA